MLVLDSDSRDPSSHLLSAGRGELAQHPQLLGRACSKAPLVHQPLFCGGGRGKGVGRYLGSLALGIKPLLILFPCAASGVF